MILSPTRRDLIAVGAGGAAALAVGGGATPAEFPRRGGRIRVAMQSASQADTFDPARGELSTDYVRQNMVYSGLTEFDGALNPKPALAESLDSRDRRVWSIKLRAGVTFHDGTPLRAQDVVWSLLRHKDPATASNARPMAEQFASVSAAGSREVRLELTGPNADLPTILATTPFLILREGARDFRSPNGTGPFICRQFIPGVRTVVRRNPNYWKSGPPWLDEIEMISIPDEIARVNALLAGDVQLIASVGPHSGKRIAGSAGHGVLETRSGEYTDLIVRQDLRPTGDPAFTEAMKLLLDRALIRRAVFRGFASIANDQPIPPQNRYFLQGLPQRPYDPDRAKFLLRKAGLLGERLPVYASAAADGSVDMASILQESAAGIGLKLAISRMPADGYWSTHWGRHPLTFGNINPRPTADLLFSLLFKSDAPLNEAHWKDARFDQLLLAARGEADESRRRMLYGDMQELVHRSGGIGIPVFISMLDAFDRRLKGFGAIPVGGMMGYAFAEHVWWDPRG